MACAPQFGVNYDDDSCSGSVRAGIKKVLLVQFKDEADMVKHDKLCLAEQQIFFEECMNSDKLVYFPIDMGKEVPPDTPNITFKT